MNYKLILAVIGIIGFIQWYNNRPVSLGPGAFAPDEPVQVDIKKPTPFEFKGFTFTPLAEFDIHARVLSRENYYAGVEADLSPIDLALGWGAMSDESVLAYFDISQRNRWYHWSYKELPIPFNQVVESSANMHMIPADDFVHSQLDDVREGNIIRLKGKLVAISRSDGWRWKSSLTRKDSGGGACEVIYVESFEIER
mgnify:CR=1 FL=1